ncbi:hypothetical protein GC173_01795 [bacterium]|nr:hypothetical protein [bacterium]
MANDNLDSSIRYPGSSWDTVEQAAQAADRQPAFLLVLGRHATLPSERKVAAFAQALHLDPFTARQWLLAPTPRIIRRENRHDKVLEWVSWFRAIGIRAFDLPETHLAEQEFIAPSTLALAGDELVVEFDDKRRETLSVHDLLCGVWGEVQERTTTETTSQAVGCELPAHRKTSLHAELTLDLHRVDSSLSIRLAQDQIRWSAVYPDETGQSSMHMRRLLKQVRTLWPRLPIMEDFGRAEPVLGTSRELLGSSTYLQSNWMGGGGRLRLQREKTFHESGRGPFAIYSTLLRLEMLRLGPPH